MTNEKTDRMKAAEWLASAPPGVVTLHYCAERDEFLTVVTLPREKKSVKLDRPPCESSRRNDASASCAKTLGARHRRGEGCRSGLRRT